MKLSAVCCTFGRDQLVAQSVRMFEIQTYKNADLLVYDTSGRLPNICGDRWRIVSNFVPDVSFAETRTRAVRMTDGDAIVMWDDDDQYFPWHLSAHAVALSQGMWSAASLAWDEEQDGRLILSQSYKTIWPNDVCYGGAWAYYRKVFEDMGGYPIKPNPTTDNDIQFRDAIMRRFGNPIDTICPDFPDASYLYCRFRSSGDHASVVPPPVMAERRKVQLPPVNTFAPTWPKNYMCGLPINPTAQKRKW